MTIIRQPVLVVETSTNRKTGEVSATYSPIQTCPKDCVFMNKGCYAQSGFCGIKFRRMSQAAKALSVEEIVKMECDGIRKLTGTKPLRLHVTGDCLDSESAIQLSDACAEYTSKNNMPAWTYTHNWRTADRECWGGISVLASCETIQDVVEANERGYAASLVSTRYDKSTEGFVFVRCPAQFSHKTCRKCKLCFSDTMMNGRSIAVFFGTHSHSRIASSAIFDRQQMSFGGW